MCKPGSVHAESRRAADSATSVLRVTGNSLAVDRAAVTDMTRQTVILRQASVSTVNTTLLGKTAKSVRLVTMVMRPLVSVSVSPRAHSFLPYLIETGRIPLTAKQLFVSGNFF